jgi:hypothetical protein
MGLFDNVKSTQKKKTNNLGNPNSLENKVSSHADNIQNRVNEIAPKKKTNLFNLVKDNMPNLFTKGQAPEKSLLEKTSDNISNRLDGKNTGIDIANRQGLDNMAGLQGAISRSNDTFRTVSGTNKDGTANLDERRENATLVDSLSRHNANIARMRSDDQILAANQALNTQNVINQGKGLDLQEKALDQTIENNQLQNQLNVFGATSEFMSDENVKNVIQQLTGNANITINPNSIQGTTLEQIKDDIRNNVKDQKGNPLPDHVIDKTANAMMLQQMNSNAEAMGMQGGISGIAPELNKTETQFESFYGPDWYNKVIEAGAGGKLNVVVGQKTERRGKTTFETVDDVRKIKITPEMIESAKNHKEWDEIFGTIED